MSYHTPAGTALGNYYGQADQQPKRPSFGVWNALMFGSVLAAGAISYNRNKSLPWAFGSSLVSLPYLAYMGLLKFQGKKVLKNPKHKRSRKGKYKAKRGRGPGRSSRQTRATSGQRSTIRRRRKRRR